MREKEFLDRKVSFFFEILLGFLQSFLTPLGIFWIFLLIKRIETQSSLRGRVQIAWWSSFIYYTANLYWIAFSLTIEIDKFWWLLPFGVFALPVYLAIFPALSTLWFKKNNFPHLFAFSWIALEWVRGWIFTGFPWALAGHSWLDTNIIQLASWCGVLPLSLLVFYYHPLIFKQKKNLYTLLNSITLLIVMYFPISIENTFFDEKVRLVQPNITQFQKWDPYKGEERFQSLLSLSQTNDPTVKAIILPETAFTFFLDTFPERIKQIQAVTPPNGYFLTGAPRKDWIYSERGQDYNMRTSLLALNSKGEIVDYYDKTHILPFGEYLPQPIRHFFPKISKFTHGDKDYTPGIGPRNLNLPGLPSFNPIICYESIFPEEIVTPQRADFILLITNDAWFGNSVGPQQHLNLSRIRAIEQRLSVIRVANTGISGVIDPRGHLLEFLPLGKRDAVNVAIPKPLDQPFYSKYLYLEKYIMSILCILLMVELLIRLKRYKGQKNDR